MANPMLAAMAVVHLLTAAAFVAVGRRFLERHVAPGHGMARNAFVAWWFGFATYLGLQGVLDLVAAFGPPPLGLFVAFRALSGPLLAAAAGGLAYHILFLWSGRAAWAVPLAFYYGAAGALYSAWILLHRPNSVAASDWGVELTYAIPLQGWLWNVILASMGLPLVLGSLGFLALARKVQEREGRYRVLLVGSSLLVWVTSGYLAQVGGGVVVRFVTIVLLGLLTAAAVTAAYFPPAPVRRWLAKGNAGPTP